MVRKPGTPWSQRDGGRLARCRTQTAVGGWGKSRERWAHGLQRRVGVCDLFAFVHRVQIRGYPLCHDLQKHSPQDNR